VPDQTANCLILAVDRYGETVVVRCTGRLVAGVSQQLHLEVSQLIPGSKRVVLDCLELTHMDSTGIGTLVRLYVHAKSAGCSLELFNMGKSVRQLLGVTHLLSVLESVGQHHIKMG
jgi:anti-sigma B factor antagonist